MIDLATNAFTGESPMQLSEMSINIEQIMIIEYPLLYEISCSILLPGLMLHISIFMGKYIIKKPDQMVRFFWILITPFFHYGKVFLYTIHRLFSLIRLLLNDEMLCTPLSSKVNDFFYWYNTNSQNG